MVHDLYANKSTNLTFDLDLDLKHDVNMLRNIINDAYELFFTKNLGVQLNTHDLMWIRPWAELD